MLLDIAINILWLVIGIIALLGVIWLGFKALRLFMQVDPRIEQAVYLIALILIIIAALSLLAGRGTFVPGFFRHSTGAVPGAAVAALPATPAGHHAT